MLPTDTHKPVKAARTDRIDARLSGELKFCLNTPLRCKVAA